MKLSSIIMMTVLCLAAANSRSQSAEKVSQIRILVNDKETLNRIWSSGIDYEGVEGKIGGWMYFVAAENEQARLTNLGIPYEVVIGDLAGYYEKRLQEKAPPFLGFGFGSMGGFYTNSEVIQQLDSMRLQYPNLITARDSIGRTQQLRACMSSESFGQM